MLEPAAHHGPGSAMPVALGFGTDEVYASINGFGSVEDKLVGKLVKIDL